MSYGLQSNCHICRKKTNCVDSTFVQAAITGIHSVNWANGIQKSLHLGGGTIVIDCCNFDDERQMPATPECPEPTPKSCGDCEGRQPDCPSQPCDSQVK